MSQPIADFLEIESEDALTRVVFGIVDSAVGLITGLLPGCTDLLDGDVVAPLELLLRNHSGREITATVFVLDEDDAVRFDAVFWMDSAMSKIVEMAEEATAGDEYDSHPRAEPWEPCGLRRA